MILKREYFQKNKAFFLISLAIILTAFLSLFSKYIGENPFQKEKFLNSPVQLIVGENIKCYIVESSNCILVTDKENRWINTIEAENSFSYANAVAIGKDDTLYIHDKLYSESGSVVYGERILQVSSDGQKQTVLYEISTLDETGMQVVKLDSLKFMNNQLYFSRIDKEGIHIFSIIEGEVLECAFMPITDAWNVISDTSFNQDMEIAAAMINGDVVVWKDGKSQFIYSARENDNEEYFSIISELGYGDNGSLYLCDVGKREIYQVSVDKSQIKTISSRKQDLQMQGTQFSELPIYTGMNIGNNTLSVLSAEYSCDGSTAEEFYTYELLLFSEDGSEVVAVHSIDISIQGRILIISVYLAMIGLLLLFFYVCKNVWNLLRCIQPETNVKMQLLLAVTAILVTIGVSYIIFNNCNARFINESIAKLSNVAYLIGEHIDEELLAEMQTPDDYYTPEYEDINKRVKDVLQNKVNSDSHMYCVVYKVKNDVVCEVYRDDRLHGVMYPMAGTYSNSIEEYIALENDYQVSYELSLAEGSYMYVVVPIYDKQGTPIAFVETGMDYTTFRDENRELYINVLMLAAMAVIIVILLFSEMLYVIQAINVKKIQQLSPDIIRPLSFLFFMIANLSTAFLPIYGMNLWDETFPIRVEMAAALPISAELTMAAISAFACGFFIKKLGVRLVCILGAGCYVGGSLLSAFAGNLWILIVANIICGVGSGFLSIAFNSWAAGYETEEKQNKGFIHINASYLVGLNCGTVIGSIIWENFGIQTVYFFSAFLAIILMILVLIMIGKIDIISEEETESLGKIGDLFTPTVIRYFLYITVPYLICTAFLEYFFPIQAEQNGLSALHISMAFLISGLISIYIGSSLAEPIMQIFGMKKAMILASFFYATALLYLVINPSVWSCYIVVILFAIADSFGLSAQSVYFSSLPEVKKVGQSKALGVNSTVESITSASGSLIFGAALLLGTQKGILVIAVMFSLFLLLFVIKER